MAEGDHHGGSNCTADNYTPLTDAQRIVLVIVHYLTFVLTAWLVWAFVRKYDIIKNRTWSPVLLLTGFIWLQLAAAFEIGNHYYVNEFQLYDPESDLINASFSFFNFGAQDIMALGLRKKGVPLWRKIDYKPCCNKSAVLNGISMVIDFLFIILIPLRPIVYAFVGRQLSVTILSPFGALAGIFILLRVYYNLGPNGYTLGGGIGFFFLAILGVILNSVYRTTCIEAVHIGIGGSFITSCIPLAIALEFAQDLPPNRDDTAEADVEDGEKEEEA